MSGMIEAGWEFVWAAYGSTAIVLTFYTAYLVTADRRETRRGAERESRP